VQPCGIIHKPISPDFLQVMMTATVFGLLLGSVTVFLAHRTSDSFTDGEEAAQAMGMPLFGSVSEIISRRQRRLRQLRNHVLMPLNVAAIAAVLLSLTSLLYLALEKPHVLDAWLGSTGLAAEPMRDARVHAGSTLHDPREKGQDG
jgi:hypothetical protein